MGCAAAALSVVLCLAAAPARGQLDDGEIDARVRSVLADPSFQTELPIGGDEHADGRSPSDGGADRPAPQRRSAGADGRSSSRPPSRPADDRPLREGGSDDLRPRRRAAEVPQPSISLGGGVAIVRALFYVLVAALVVVLLFALVSAVGRHRRLAVRLADDDEGAPGGEAEVPPTLSELERLLRAGDLAEAVHLLLRLALKHLEKGAGGPLPAGLTSREVLRRSRLGGDERESLATLVEAVERSLFGALPVTRREYDTCAAAFERLTGRGAAA